MAKVKRDVNRIGVDEKVYVKLLDGTKLKGRLQQIGDQYLVLIEDRTADTRRIGFAQVANIGRVADSPFSSPAAWLGLALIPTIIGFSIWAKDKD